MEKFDMYSNELVWYFHHLHEANVRIEVSPSIYPCNYVCPLHFSSHSAIFLPFLFFLFSSSSFPFLSNLYLLVHKNILKLFKYIRRIKIGTSKSPFLLRKIICYYYKLRGNKYQNQENY